jgi:hypothetical protein
MAAPDTTLCSYRHSSVSPTRLFIERRLSKPAKCVNGFSVGGHRVGGKQGARGLVHEGHEFVGKAGHGAADTDAANIGAPAYAGHPATFADVTLDHRSPAAQFDDALNIPVLGREFGLLVVATPVTSFVDGLTKKPGRAKAFVQGDHGSPSGGHMKQIK